ncbi:MAG: hypothetical protein IPH77_06815 [Ignavibacteria bacterium]|nr:hypothetical protein [Ignavibacteria bacterium]
MDREFSNFVKKIAGNIAFTGAVLLPVTLFLSFLVIPDIALSGSVFTYTSLAFISLLFLCNFLYAVIKNSEVKYIGAAFYLLIISLGFIILKNQAAFGAASEKHLAVINLKAQELEKRKKERQLILQALMVRKFITGYVLHVINLMLRL